MSMASLNREICGLARIALNNPKLRAKDIMEWSTGKVEPQEGEIVIVLGAPLTGINICVEKKYDKRPESGSSAKSADNKKESR